MPDTWRCGKPSMPEHSLLLRGKPGSFAGRAPAPIPRSLSARLTFVLAGGTMCFMAGLASSARAVFDVR
jgi:hypothetical protein